MQPEDLSLRVPLLDAREEAVVHVLLHAEVRVGVEPLVGGDVVRPAEWLQRVAQIPQRVVATSYALQVALEAVRSLEPDGIEVEVVNLRSVKPWDEDAVVQSVQRTGRLVVVDGGWRSFGITAEIAATVAARAFASLRAPVERVALPDAPAPMSGPLEQAYYLSSSDVVTAVHRTLSYSQER